LLFGEEVEPSVDLVFEVLTVLCVDHVESGIDLFDGVSVKAHVRAGRTDIGCVGSKTHGLQFRLPTFGVLQPFEGPLLTFKAVLKQLAHDIKGFKQAG